MATTYSTYLIKCLTGVHAGDGSSSGTIDNPIQRERVTSFPVFRDSTLRGAIREHFELDYEEKANDCFLPSFGHRDKGDKNSALDVYPARILFLPVRSFAGVFAYVSCPMVLERFNEELKLRKASPFFKDIPKLTDNNTSLACRTLEIGETNKVGLEEFLFDNTERTNFFETLGIFLGHDRLKTHGALVSNDMFTYMTKRFTEKVTRNRIDLNTGTASDTGLFNEEFLPEETLLYAQFGFANEFSTDKDRKKATDLQQYFDGFLKENPVCNLGGDKSIGKGAIQFTPLNTQDHD